MTSRPPEHTRAKTNLWFRRAVFSGLIGSSVVLSAQAPATPSAPPAPTITILSPENDSFVSGPTVLRARIEPPEAAVGVTFFANGRQVCALKGQPFECEWDAGATISEHQIR